MLSNTNKNYTYMDTEKLTKVKELRSKMEGISIKFCQEALEKNNYDLELACQWLKEKAKLFRKEQVNGDTQEQKFSIVNIIISFYEFDQILSNLT